MDFKSSILGARSRHQEINEYLDSLTDDEKRHVRRRLNQNTALRVKLSLPAELVGQIVEFLDVKDLISLRDVKFPSELQTSRWFDFWFQETSLDAIAHGQFRLLALKDDYQNLKDSQQKTNWVLNAIKDYENRKNGIFTSKDLGFLGDIAISPSTRYCNDRIAMSMGEGFSVLGCSSGKAVTLMVPDRTSATNWHISDNFFVALDDVQAKVYAWRLDDLDEPLQLQAKSLPNAALNICATGHRVIIKNFDIGVGKDTTVLVWDLSNNKLLEQKFTIPDHLIGWLVFLHPTKQEICYVLLRTMSDSQCVISVEKHVHGIKVSSVSTNVRNGSFKSTQGFVTKLADLSGSYLVSIVIEELAAFATTFNVFTETFQEVSWEIPNTGLRSGEKVAFWEGQIITMGMLNEVLNSARYI